MRGIKLSDSKNWTSPPAHIEPYSEVLNEWTGNKSTTRATGCRDQEFQRTSIVSLSPPFLRASGQTFFLIFCSFFFRFPSRSATSLPKMVTSLMLFLYHIFPTFCYTLWIMFRVVIAYSWRRIPIVPVTSYRSSAYVKTPAQMSGGS